MSRCKTIATLDTAITYRGRSSRVVLLALARRLVDPSVALSVSTRASSNERESERDALAVDVRQAHEVARALAVRPAVRSEARVVLGAPVLLRGLWRPRHSPERPSVRVTRGRARITRRTSLPPSFMALTSASVNLDIESDLTRCANSRLHETHRASVAYVQQYDTQAIGVDVLDPTARRAHERIEVQADVLRHLHERDTQAVVSDSESCQCAAYVDAPFRCSQSSGGSLDSRAGTRGAPWCASPPGASLLRPRCPLCRVTLVVKRERESDVVAKVCGEWLVVVEW